jgi:hypothetical protein
MMLAVLAACGGAADGEASAVATVPPTVTARPTPTATPVRLPETADALCRWIGNQILVEPDRLTECAVDDERASSAWLRIAYRMDRGAMDRAALLTAAEVSEILHTLTEVGYQDYARVEIVATYPTKDKFGNTEETAAFRADWALSTLDKVNWAGIDFPALLDLSSPPRLEMSDAFAAAIR